MSERNEESGEKKVEKKEGAAAPANGVENKGFDVEKGDPSAEAKVCFYVKSPEMEGTRNCKLHRYSKFYIIFITVIYVD